MIKDGSLSVMLTKTPPPDLRRKKIENKLNYIQDMAKIKFQSTNHGSKSVKSKEKN
jgi:hypothetical protein